MSSHEADDVAKPPIDNVGGVIDQDAPSADHFVKEHASHVPWADDAPIVREDEQYTPSPEDGLMPPFGNPPPEDRDL